MSKLSGFVMAGALLLSGCGAGYELADLRVYTSPAAKYWATQKIAKPTAAYDDGSAAVARRTVAWIGTDTVLVEDIFLKDVYPVGPALAMAPHTSILRAIKAKDGAEVWSRPIESRVVAAFSGLLLTPSSVWWGRRDGKQHRYSPFDLKSGQPGAEVVVASSHQVKLSPDGSVVFVIDRAEGTTTLRAYKSSGDRLWDAKVAAMSDLPTVDVSDKTVFVSGADLSAFDAQTGKPAFASVPFGKARESLWLVDQAPLLAAGSSVRLFSTSGQPAWQRDLPGPVLLVASGKSEIYVVVGGATPAIVALRKAKGDEAWRAALPAGEAPSGDLAAGKEAVALTTTSHLLVAAAKDGSLDSIDLPIGFAKTADGQDVQSRLPDHVAWDGTAVVVAGELAVARFETKRLRQTWAFFAEAAIGGSPAWEGFQTVRGRRRGAAPKLDHATMAAIRERQNQAAALGAASQAVTNLGASFNNVSGPAAASVSMAGATVGLGLSGMAAGASFAADRMQKVGEAHRELVQVQLEMAYRRHALALQGDYYVRPMQWAGGQGALLVNWKTGAWKEVVTGPDEPLIANYYPLLPLAVVSPDNKTVITHGPGVDESRHRVIPGYFFIGKLADLTQMFDLGPDGFASATTYAEESVTRRPFGRAK